MTNRNLDPAFDGFKKYEQLSVFESAAACPSEEEVEHMENNVMAKCLDELGRNQGLFLVSLMSSIKSARNIVDLPAHGEVAKQKQRLLKFQDMLPIDMEKAEKFITEHLGADAWNELIK